LSSGPAALDAGDVRAWEWTALPEDWRATIIATSKRKGYQTPQEFLADGKAIWQPPIPISDVSERFRDDASKWREALLPLLQRQHDAAPGELLRLGLLECKRVFGREVSESTWRRHFDTAVRRDSGLDQWAVLDIYLADEAYAQAPARSESPSTPGDLVALTEAFQQVENPSKLTVEDRDFVWRAILACPAPRAEVLDYAFKSLPGLALTRQALDKGFLRKSRKPKDGRPGRSGRPAVALCPGCVALVQGAAVELDGDLAQGWRRLHLSKALCSKCAALWHFDARSNKSYVPLAVQNQVMPAVAAAVVHRRGPHAARLASPYVLRRRDIGPGDVFEADDVKFNTLFHTVPGQSGLVWNTDENGRPYVGCGECLLMLDRASLYPVGYRLIAGRVDSKGKQIHASYTGFDIRLLMLRVHDRVGLAHLGYQFENGIWRSRLVAGQKAKEWNFNEWRETERGLNELGIVMGSSHKGIRHAQAGNPRTKIIERVFRSVQERMRYIPGFVGFNQREYRPEVVNDFLRRVSIGKEHPGEMFLSMEQFRNVLDVELMSYAREPQNGRWLPGVSPLEVWEGGIAGFKGVKDRPLRKLSNSERHLLSTHWRKISVTQHGIKFHVGSQHLLFWGDPLIPWMHKTLPVRWNIEEPELLHCLPPGQPAFTLKAKIQDSWTASREQQAESSAERQRWMRHGKAIYDNLPHPLLSNLVLDGRAGENARNQGEAIAQATLEHRAELQASEDESKRLAALARTLNVPVEADGPPSERTIQAQRRRMERMKREMEENQERDASV
jgi:hypothetical protein